MDELLEVSMRTRLTHAIHGFVGMFPDVPIIVTSRKIGYREAPLDEDIFQAYTLGGFSRSAVREYSHKWFSLDESLSEAQRSLTADSFVNQSELVADLRSSPLMLALMCGLYSVENYIPKNRPDVYERCSLMLFQNWDTSRSIMVLLPFEAPLRPAISALAFWIYQEESRQSGIDRSEIVRFVGSYLHGRRYESLDEATEAAERFIDFCTGRAWVLTDLGSNAFEPKYGFTHRTFLEYFAAKEISRNYVTPEALLSYLRPFIRRAENDVVAQIALQLLGVNNADGADEFLRQLVDGLQDADLDTDSCRNLTSFAARAISYIVPSPATLRAITRQAYRLFEIDPGSLPDRVTEMSPMYDILLAATENLAPIGRAIAECLTETVSKDQSLPEHVAGLAVYPHSFANAKPNSFITKAHYEFWGLAAVDYREIVDACLSIADATQRPEWLRYYLFARSRLHADEAFHGHIWKFFATDEPAFVSQPCSAFGLLAHIAETGQEVRSEYVIPGGIRGDFAARIVKIMLATVQPWKSEARPGYAEQYDSKTFARDELWGDPRINSLYALLSAVFTDHLLLAEMGEDCKAGVVLAERRRTIFHEVTGALFEGTYVGSLPVSAVARNFLHGWLAGGTRTVKIESEHSPTAAGT